MFNSGISHQLSQKMFLVRLPKILLCLLLSNLNFPRIHFSSCNGWSNGIKLSWLFWKKDFFFGRKRCLRNITCGKHIKYVTLHSFSSMYDPHLDSPWFVWLIWHLSAYWENLIYYIHFLYWIWGWLSDPSNHDKIGETNYLHVTNSSKYSPIWW